VGDVVGKPYPSLGQGVVECPYPYIYPRPYHGKKVLDYPGGLL